LRSELGKRIFSTLSEGGRRPKGRLKNVLKNNRIGSTLKWTTLTLEERTCLTSGKKGWIIDDKSGKGVRTWIRERKERNGRSAKKWVGKGAIS